VKTFLTVFGAVALSLLAIAGIGIGVAIYNGKTLDTESKQYVESSVAAIAAAWDRKQLFERATPELRQSVKPEEINVLFGSLVRLGRLANAEEAKGQAAVSFFPGSGSVVSATYTEYASFQNGDATFRIGVLKRNGQWQINNFYVDFAPPRRATNDRSHDTVAQQPAQRPDQELVNRYYQDALAADGQSLLLVDSAKIGDVEKFHYIAVSNNLELAIERVRCENSTCQVLMENALKLTNSRASSSAGRFEVIAAVEFRANWESGFSRIYTAVFRLPDSLLSWTVTVQDQAAFAADPYFNNLTSMVNHQRYDIARERNNVEEGRWATQSSQWAKYLLTQGKAQEAIDILKRLLITAPSNYQAQLDLAEASSDRDAAANIARVAFDNAEDGQIIQRAARLLKIDQPGLDSIPFLSARERGLQLILIPLEPCNIQFLKEAAVAYESMTQVPVKIRRLKEDWKFDDPDRIPEQKRIQQAILQFEKHHIDFSGWTQQRYADELKDAAQKADALTAFNVKTFLATLDRKKPQYKIDKYLPKLTAILANYRSPDIRTMYVGVTAANTFLGDANYVFSASQQSQAGMASILSYSMMLAEPLNEPYGSRKRLAERIAKELVPASLKALNIPRPSDPSDPYSYSDSVARLDQKTLRLSVQVRTELERFRSEQ
jgi:hypothetical protein